MAALQRGGQLFMASSSSFSARHTRLSAVGGGAAARAARRGLGPLPLLLAPRSGSSSFGPAAAPTPASRRPAVTVHAANRVAVAAAAATAAFPGLAAAVAPCAPLAVAGAAGTLGAVALLLALAPNSSLARRAARSSVPYALIALAYGAVLLASWQTDTLSLMMPGSWADGFKGGFNPQFFPSLASVQALFSRGLTAASFVIHVAAINLFAARHIYNRGWEERVPTRHSVLLAAVAGPLGLLSHLLTVALYAGASAAAGRDMRPRSPEVRAAAGGGGYITLVPYQE